MTTQSNSRKYNTQRTVGLWLIYIGSLIIVSAISGGEGYIQPFILGFGYGIGYFLIFGLPYVNQRLSYGKNSKFQERMDNISVVITIALCTLCGFVIGFNDLRLLWLCIFVIIGIHFFGFYFSQGKIMILLGGLTILNSLIGIMMLATPFLLFAVIDGIIKIIFGVQMLFNPKKVSKS